MIQKGKQLTEVQTDAKVSYPYMTPTQWFGIRAKLRQSVPKAIDVDWIMAALGTSEKGAKNILPQLKALGLVGADGSPSELALDIRDDGHYAEACERILESVYPDALRNAYDSADEESGKVAGWFMRNARTGQATANMQAKLYLTLLKAELPTGDEKPRTSRRRRSKKSDSTPVPETIKVAELPKLEGDSNGVTASSGPSSAAPWPNSAGPLGPTLHIDLQIHISADASNAQIDAVFQSMAKHLYGRE